MEDALATRFMKVFRSLNKLFTQSGQMDDCSARELWMLHVISHGKICGLEVTNTSLSEFLNQSKPAVSQTLNELEKKGYIQRSIDQDNRRRTCIELTPLGIEQEKEFRAQAMRYLSSVFAQMGHEKVETFVGLSEEFVATMIAEKQRKSE